MADRTVAPSNMMEIGAQWRRLHQLEEPPTRSDLIGAFPHRVWCDVNGRILIEEYSITGMGHGTPIATTGPNSYGAGGPFMLDVGISSTFHIARSWGLTMLAEGVGKHLLPHIFGSQPTAIDRAREAETKVDVSGASGPPNPSVQRATGVRKIIEDALRAAGLVR